MAIAQYVFVRSDAGLKKGAAVAQACHAAIAAIDAFKDADETKAYLAERGTMTTVVFKMDAREHADLARFLRDRGFDFYEWSEQPENFCTALALRPYEKSAHDDLRAFLAPFKLY